ncbi:MAG: ankyrin repeat domain-containing protein [Myxococcales bacterium]|nr:ankyrin repeat domain-containing protein [Myxococcales bacterium]
MLETQAPSADFVPRLMQERAVEARSMGLPAPSPLTLDPVRVRDVTVRLRVDGAIVAERTITGSLEPHHAGTLEVAGDRSVVDAVKRGHFSLEAEMQVPMASYSSLTVKVDERAVSDSRTEAFRSVVQQTSSTRSSFLFGGFRQATRRRLEESRADATSFEGSSSSTSVLIIDGDAATERHLDEMLGFIRREKAQFLAAHRAAAAAAQSGGRIDLANIHIDYLRAVEANDSGEQDRILRMMTAFATDDLGGFLAAGVAFSSASGSARDEFHAVSAAHVRSEHRGRYSEMHIRTALAKYNLSLTDFPDVPALLSEQRFDESSGCLDNPHPNRDAATQCLWTAVERGDVTMTTRALQARAYVEGRDRDGRTVLMHAAMRGDGALVAVLLRWGASAAEADVDGLTAVDHADRAGYPELARELRRGSGDSGDGARTAPVSLALELAQEGYIMGVESNGRNFDRDVALSLRPGNHTIKFRVHARVVVPYDVAPLAMQRGLVPFSWGPGGVVFEVVADLTHQLPVVAGAGPRRDTLRIGLDLRRGSYSIA